MCRISGELKHLLVGVLSQGTLLEGIKKGTQKSCYLGGHASTDDVVEQISDEVHDPVE